MRRTVPAVLAACLAVVGPTLAATDSPAHSAAPAPASSALGGSTAPATAGPSAEPTAETSSESAAESIAESTAGPAASARVVTVGYGPHSAQRMDVYSPTRVLERDRGAVVLVHGGSWVTGDKADLAPYALQLAGEGYVVASINYRLATEAPWPAQRRDAIAAVRYLRGHTKEFQVDPDRIVMIGFSAGAQIATAAATWGTGSALLRGVVALSGPLDPRRVVLDGRRGLDSVLVRSLLGCRPIACPGRYRDATPQTQLSRDDVPSLLFASRLEWVDPANSIGFVARARAVGLSSRLVRMSGSQHARTYWDRAWPVIRDWVSVRLAV